MSKKTHKAANILIVDDEPVNLKLLDKLLSGQGYNNLSLLQDSSKVMEQYHKQRPDLILLDLNMPEPDGYQVLESIKQLNDALCPPIVILTAQSGRDFLIKALSLGARDFITKPFDRVELLMRVENQLEVHLAQRILHDQKAVLEELVAERTLMLEQARVDVIERLGRAAEYKDNETGFHILRMSKVSALLANSLGWSSERIELMLNASPMHDIGKIGIPDAVLLKPGKLLPDEWEIMQTHSQLGADILSGGRSELIQLAREIALYHHERWDGNGYPEALKAESIPQSARIVAVADVFDALTSERPYKEAWSFNDAVAYIREQSGKHFDPEVVEHFMGNLDEIVEICEQYSEPAS